MIETYKVDFKHQYQSAKYNLLVLVIFISMALYSYYNIENPVYSPLPFWSLFIIIPSLPAIFFHTSYYLKNKDIILTIDKKKRTLVIISKHETKTYHFNDISHITQKLGIHYKGQPKGSGPGINPVPWTNYGYIKIKFRDGNIYYFTSIMIDVPSFDIGVPYITKYTWWPYLKRQDTNNKKRDPNISKLRKQVKRAQREKLALFKGNFGDHSYAELQQELSNNKKLKRLEIEAIQELLKEKI